MIATMNDTASLASIHRVANHARGNFESHLNCGAVSREIADALHATLGLEPVLIEDGCIRPTPRSVFGAEHAFVIVPSEQIADHSRTLIVDGTLDQFCDENKDDGLVGISLGPRESFDHVDLIDNRNDRWERFRWPPETTD